MATKINPIRPIVINANYETCGYDFTADRYYFYTIEVDSPYDNYRVFTGKAWTRRYKTIHGEIQLEISDIIKPYMYDGWNLIQPEKIDEQTYGTIWNASGEYLYSLDKNWFKEAGFGVTNVYIHFYEDTSNITVSNSIAEATMSVQVTSAWNIKNEVYQASEGFRTQELTELEFGSTFVSHYPKIMTNNFGLYGLINSSNSYLANAFSFNSGAVYKIGNRAAYSGSIQMNVNGEDLKAGGFIPFKYNMVDVINSLDPTAFTEPVVFEQLVGGNSSRATQNTFTTGTSAAYTPENTWVGGNAQPHSAAVEGYDDRNNVYLIELPTSSQQFRPYKYKIAELDECYAKYYLVWQTKSCAPVCYGFDGNTVISQDFENTYMTDWYKRDLLKIQKIKNKYNLKSGIIDKRTYTVMEDIFTSPWIILYNTEEDKSTYVKVIDNSFTRKNSVKEDRQPFRFEINLQEIDNVTILH